MHETIQEMDQIPQYLASFYDADEEKHEELEPNVVSELFLRMRCDVSGTAIIFLQTNGTLIA